jgi:hypothetical protein
LEARWPAADWGGPDHRDGPGHDDRLDAAADFDHADRPDIIAGGGKPHQPPPPLPPAGKGPPTSSPPPPTGSPAGDPNGGWGGRADSWIERMMRRIVGGTLQAGHGLGSMASQAWGGIKQAGGGMAAAGSSAIEAGSGILATVSKAAGPIGAGIATAVGVGTKVITTSLEALKDARGNA